MSASSTLRSAQMQHDGVLSEETPSAPTTYRFCDPPCVHFGDASAEYQAVTNGAVLFDVSDRTQIEVGGTDAKQFLHNFCTNDVMRLAPGDGCEAFVANVKGRVLAHVFVFLSEESIWIETSPGAEESLIAHFDRYLIREDVELHGRTAAFGELLLAGPESRARLASLNIQADGLEAYHHMTVRWRESILSVRRVDLLGQPGFFLSVDRTSLVSLWNELIAVDVRPGGAQAFHAHRIESKFPLYGLDLSDDNLPQEAARTQLAISFTKGCYLGQEPIARIDAVGHVNRELRGLRLDSGPIPEPGTKVVADDGRDVGVITSSAQSAATNKPVALAYLRSGYTGQDTPVFVDIDDLTVRGVVF